MAWLSWQPNETAWESAICLANADGQQYEDYADDQQEEEIRTHFRYGLQDCNSKQDEETYIQRSLDLFRKTRDDLAELIRLVHEDGRAATCPGATSILICKHEFFKKLCKEIVELQASIKTSYEQTVSANREYLATLSGSSDNAEPVEVPAASSQEAAPEEQQAQFYNDKGELFAVCRTHEDLLDEHLDSKSISEAINYHVSRVTAAANKAKALAGWTEDNKFPIELCTLKRKLSREELKTPKSSDSPEPKERRFAVVDRIKSGKNKGWVFREIKPSVKPFRED